MPDEVFEEIAAAKRPAREERYWQAEVEETPVSGDIDGPARAGLERLMSSVDAVWLDVERKKRFRLDEGLVNEPLQLIGSVRLAGGEDRPQRFAQMLLVTADHLNKHDRLDFFEAPMLVAEVAALGTQIDEIDGLGSEGLEKLRRLPSMTDSEVASTVYELVVGSAARRKGLNVEMLPPVKHWKTPDFRIHDLAVPASLECKRRLGVLNYELKEAEHVRELYEAIRVELTRAHARVDVTFTDEVRTVDAVGFANVVLPLVRGSPDRRSTIAAWGSVSVETLPYTATIARTRVYSPDYMESVFEWRANAEWDGIVCESDPPASLVVERVRGPRALRWVSRSETAVQKKARGITSLWADAMLQIPGGDMGFIYVAYPEVNRAEIADARTREIMEASARWTHRWQIALGTSVVNRLYPRSKGCGVPDFIESAMPLAPNGDEYFVDLVPTRVFTPPAEEGSEERVAEARARAVALLIERSKRRG
ncbi:MAG TPA: hypothetical protein VF057_01485 [Thermoanaerobaculia bacterium]